MTTNELQKQVESSDQLKRTEALKQFREQSIGIDALPLLRQLLEDHRVSIAILAAECIAKIGPEALTCAAGRESMPCGPDGHRVPLGWQLQVLGGKTWAYSAYPNCYSICLQALVNSKADERQLLEYIQSHIGLGRDDLLASLKALRTIGSEEALDLMRRAAAFWRPELGKGLMKKVEAILETKG